MEAHAHGSPFPPRNRRTLPPRARPRGRARGSPDRAPRHRRPRAGARRQPARPRPGRAGQARRDEGGRSRAPRLRVDGQERRHGEPPHHRAAKKDSRGHGRRAKRRRDLPAADRDWELPGHAGRREGPQPLALPRLHGLRAAPVDAAGPRRACPGGDESEAGLLPQQHERPQLQQAAPGSPGDADGPSCAAPSTRTRPTSRASSSTSRACAPARTCSATGATPRTPSPRARRPTTPRRSASSSFAGAAGCTVSTLKSCPRTRRC